MIRNVSFLYAKAGSTEVFESVGRKEGQDPHDVCIRKIEHDGRKADICDGDHSLLVH